MARLYTCGWETGSVDESVGGLSATVTGDNMGAVTSPVRSGNYSLRVDYSTTASTGGRVNNLVTGAGSANTLFIRIYLYVAAIPTERSAVIRTHNVGTAVGTRGSVSLNTDGSVQVYNGATAVGSASSALTTNTWYMIELSSNCTGTNQVVTLQVDGVPIASGVSFANTNQDTAVQLGWSATGTAGPTKAGTYYIDDYAVNYEGGTNQTTFPGTGSLLMLLPVSDSAIGTGWTTSGGATTGLWDNVNNTPPTGIADTTANAGHQIRNAASAANSNYDAAVTDYAAAGIAASDTITLVAFLIGTGAPSATSPKAGTTIIVSNPVGAAASSSFNFYQGTTVAGTYPTGWQWRMSSNNTEVGDISAGNRTVQPVIRVTQVTSSTRIAMVDFLGMYVEYVPGTPSFLPWKPRLGPNYRR